MAFVDFTSIALTYKFAKLQVILNDVLVPFTCSLIYRTFFVNQDVLLFDYDSSFTHRDWTTIRQIIKIKHIFELIDQWRRFIVILNRIHYWVSIIHGLVHRDIFSRGIERIRTTHLKTLFFILILSSVQMSSTEESHSKFGIHFIPLNNKYWKSSVAQLFVKQRVKSSYEKAKFLWSYCGSKICFY